MSAQDHVK